MRGKQMRQTFKISSHLFVLLSLLLTALLCLVGCEAKPVKGDTSAALGSKVERVNTEGDKIERANVPRVRSASFISDQILFLATYFEGDLLRTLNAGEAWDKIDTNPYDTFIQLSFIDSKRGWAINTEGEVWRTEDGGRNWALISKLNSTDPNWDGFTSAEQITFTDSLRGWIIETFTVWRTEDGGRHWKEVFSVSDPRVKGQPGAGHFINNKGWICGSEGQVYRTINGGKTWDVQTLRDAYIDHVFFVDEETGWLSHGRNGQLFHTDDGGTTWQLQPKIEDSVYIDSTYFRTKEDGWGVGRRLLKGGTGFMPLDIERNLVQGIVLRTQDGGRSWQSVQVPDGEPFFSSIYFVNDEKGWLVGRSKIYHTNDSGKTWQLVFELPAIKTREN